MEARMPSENPGDKPEGSSQKGRKRTFGGVARAKDINLDEGPSQGPKAAKTSDTQVNPQSPPQRRSKRLAGMTSPAASEDNPQSPIQRSKRKARDMTSPEDMSPKGSSRDPEGAKRRKDNKGKGKAVDMNPEGSSQDPKGARMSHEELLNTVDTLSRGDIHVFDALITQTLNKEINPLEKQVTPINAKNRINNLYQLEVYRNALSKIKSVFLDEGGAYEIKVRKKIKMLLEHGEAIKEKQTARSLSQGEHWVMEAADILRGHIENRLDAYRKHLADLEQVHTNLRRDIEISSATENLITAISNMEDPTILKLYREIESFHQLAMHATKEVLEEQVFAQEAKHHQAIEELFHRACPRILQEYKSRGVEFVLRQEETKNSYPRVKNEDGQWQLEIPIPYKYGTHDLVMRIIDRINNVRLLQDGELPSREQRAETVIEVAMTHALLGRHRASIAGYPTMQQLHNTFKRLITQRFTSGTIDRKPEALSKTLADPSALHKILVDGYAEVKNIYTGYILENDLYPSLQPGAFFGEGTVWEIHQGQEPAILGTDEYKAMAEKIAARIKKNENSAYTMNIRFQQRNNEKIYPIYLQPYYVVDGLQSRHPLNATGGESFYAGETNLEAEINEKTGKIGVLRTKDQSGHFAPYDKDDPGRAVYNALKVWEDQGYDTSTTMVELTAIEGANVLPYHNYTPPHFFDLRQQDWLTDSERYILKHGKPDIKRKARKIGKNREEAYNKLSEKERKQLDEKERKQLLNFQEEAKKRRDNRIQEDYLNLDEKERGKLSEEERQELFDLQMKDWLTDSERHILEKGEEFLKNVVRKRVDNRIKSFNELSE